MALRVSPHRTHDWMEYTPWNSEENGEEIHRETHSPIYKSTPEVNVGRKLTAHEVVVFHRRVMQGHSGFEKLVFAGAIIRLVR